MCNCNGRILHRGEISWRQLSYLLYIQTSGEPSLEVS